MLGERFGESCNTGDDSSNHEDERDDGPDDTPALRGASIALGEDAGIGFVDFSQDEIVTLFVVSRWSDG